MHLSRLLVGLASSRLRILLLGAPTTIKSPQASGPGQVITSKMDPDKAASAAASLEAAFHNCPRDGVKEKPPSEGPIDPEKASEPESPKENEALETMETGASNKSTVKQESRKANRKRGRRADGEQDAEKTKKKKKQTQRPNYFVSIPITNTQIRSAVTEVQEAVLEREPRLARAMIPVPTLHITLLVTHLAHQEQVDLAAAALTQAGPSLAELLGGAELALPFSGVAHFRNNVVFAALAPGPHTGALRSLAELLCGRFEERGLLEGDARGFEPHLTIMKLSRAPKLRSQGIKRVDPSFYSDYTSRFFGEQTVARLDLCSMLKKKQQDGYYHTETSLPLGGRRRSEPDEAELVRISKRLVDDAVSRAVQQYKQERLQNGGGPNAGQPPGNPEGDAAPKTRDANGAADSRK